MRARHMRRCPTHPDVLHLLHKLHLLLLCLHSIILVHGALGGDARDERQRGVQLSAAARPACRQQQVRDRAVCALQRIHAALL